MTPDELSVMDDLHARLDLLEAKVKAFAQRAEAKKKEAVSKSAGYFANLWSAIKGR